MSSTYAVVDRGDLAAGNLSELGQEVQHLQTSHQEHEVREGEEHGHLPVGVLVHVLADQHSVVVDFAEVSQDLHRCRMRLNTLNSSPEGGLGHRAQENLPLILRNLSLDIKHLVIV